MSDAFKRTWNDTDKASRLRFQKVVSGIFHLLVFRISPLIGWSAALLDLHIRSAEISLFELVQTIQCDVPIERAEALYACVERIDGFIDGFIQQPSSRLHHIPFLAWVHLLHAIIVLAKLSFLTAEGWDVQYLRASRLSFPSMVGRLVDKMDAAAQQSLEDSQAPNAVSARFAVYGEKMRLCKKWYDSKIRAETDAEASTAPDLRPIIPSSDPSYEGFFEGFDDGVWTDFMGDWSTVGMQF